MSEPKKLTTLQARVLAAVTAKRDPESIQADNVARARVYAERAEAWVAEVEKTMSATEARRCATMCATEAASARHFGWEGGAEGWLWARRAGAASEKACQEASRQSAGREGNCHERRD